MSTLTQLLNTAADFTLPDGSTLKLKELDVEHMGKYTEWLRQRALVTVEQLYRHDEEKKAEAERAVIRDSAAGVYDYGGEVCINSLSTVDGLSMVLVLSAEMSGKFVDFNDARKLILERNTQIIKTLAEKVIKDPKGYSAQLKKLVGPIFTKHLRTNRTKKPSKKSAKPRSRK